ncbi:MAG: hypothetical protein FWF11_01200 [Coriobacteriia bacterium]|nr:hypothetical protein [Coriobacteriia bacterium]
MLKSLPPGLLKLLVWLCTGLLLLLLLPGAAGIVWAPGCSGCHGTQTYNLQESAHTDVDCRSCHATQGTWGRIGFNQRVWYSMLLPLFPGQDITRVIQNDSCLQCHDQVFDGGIAQNRGLRVNHEECAQDVRCTVCHGGVGHPGTSEWESRYAMENCIGCHASLTSRPSLACETCHDGRLGDNRVTNSVFAVVHGPDMLYTHGVGDWQTCAPCHPDEMCARCHGGMVPHDAFIIRDHSREARRPDNQCAGCHKNEFFCDDCHGMEIPHPDGFLIVHADETDRLGWDMCLRCHARSDCDICHVGHIHPGGPKMWMESH